jgi:hypothetical protein
MPVGWLSVLKVVPWGEVITNAPKVADGARRLWSAVKKTPATEPPEPATTEASNAAPSADAEAIAALQGQLGSAERAIVALQEQMLASSELIKALAEQNTELIRRVEAMRLRGRWLVGATVAIGVAAFAALGVALAP